MIEFLSIVLIIFVLPLNISSAHEIQLRDGSRLQGTVIRTNSSSIVYEDDKGRKALSVADVHSITFEPRNNNVQCFLGNSSNVSAGQLVFLPVINEIRIRRLLSVLYLDAGFRYQRPLSEFFLGVFTRSLINDLDLGLLYHMDFVSAPNLSLSVGLDLKTWRILYSVYTGDNQSSLSIIYRIAII